MATTDKYILEIETAAAERGLKSVDGAAAGLVSRLGGLKTLAAGALAGLGVAKAVQGIQSTVDSMDKLAKEARLLGVEGDKAQKVFQEFGTVLEDAGISQDQYTEASRRAIDRLAKGGKSAESILSKIGPALQNANGELKSGPELLQAMVVAFNKGEISAKEFQDIIGVRLGPIVTRKLGEVGASAENMAAAMQKASESTDFVDQETLANAEAFNDNMAAMGRQFSQIGTQLVTALLPYMKDLSENLLAKMPDIIDFVTTAFKNLEPVFQLIGTVLSNVVVPILSKFFEILGKLAEFIGPFVETGIKAMSGAFDVLGNIVEKIIGFFTSTIELLGNIKEKATALVSGVKKGFTDMGTSITESAKTATGKVTGFFRDMYNAVVGNSFVPEMEKGVTSSFTTMKNNMVNLVGEAIKGVKTTMSNLGNAVANKFQEITGISISSLRSQMSSISSEISSTISSLTSRVGSAISGIRSRIANTARRASDFIGGFNIRNPFEGAFAGFFANGGRIPAGQFGVVGEAGPELVTGPANVTPASSGFGQNVTYNINAVDASSFRSLLAQDPEFVHRVVQRGASTTSLGRR